MASIFLFVLGALFGSFLNVIALRYDPDEFLFRRASLGGRSRCPACGHTLTWSELIPLLSFLIQRGRCRKCEAKISVRYPLVEIIAGIIFVMVGQTILPAAPGFDVGTFGAGLWFAVFCVLLLVTLIDLRFMLIPDEANVLLAVFGLTLAVLDVPPFAAAGTFVGPLGVTLGLQGNVFLNRFAAALGAAVFFGALIIITRGRGMGEGDLKFAAALGLVFGWPDTLFVIMLAFMLGAAVGVGAMLAGKKTMKSALPFGPFLAAAALLVFAAGAQLLSALGAIFSAV
ncbi:MAG TPA: prepilin peptidase [Candidatus Paceibacterota bacterium]|nr:prepilin peptidase [Candidatus Paceibacterota bacterium]